MNNWLIVLLVVDYLVVGFGYITFRCADEVRQETRQLINQFSWLLRLSNLNEQSLKVVVYGLYIYELIVFTAVWPWHLIVNAVDRLTTLRFNRHKGGDI